MGRYNPNVGGLDVGIEEKKEIKKLLDFWFEQLGRGKPQDGDECAYPSLEIKKENPFKR